VSFRYRIKSVEKEATNLGENLQPMRTAEAVALVV